MIDYGSERGPVALPVFKIGRCLLAGQAGFDSQALPPTSFNRYFNSASTALVSDKSRSTTSAPAVFN
jgi:hypothetical protein